MFCKYRNENNNLIRKCVINYLLMNTCMLLLYKETILYIAPEEV